MHSKNMRDSVDFLEESKNFNFENPDLVEDNQEDQKENVENEINDIFENDLDFELEGLGTRYSVDNTNNFVGLT